MLKLWQETGKNSRIRDSTYLLSKLQNIFNFENTLKK